MWQPQPADFWKVNSWDSSNSTVSDNLPSQNSSVNRTLTTNSTLCPNGEAQDTPFDWGVAYTAQQGTGHYFTLTSTELKYVINNWFAACCTVDGVEGAIILPFTTLNEAKEAITAVGGKYNALYKLNDHYTNRTQFGYDRMTLDYEQLTKLNGVSFRHQVWVIQIQGLYQNRLPQITKATVITGHLHLPLHPMLLYGM